MGRNKNRQAVIKIVSQQRIEDPFLQILVDVAWADGQLYRSYTLLLDPPGYSQLELEKKVLISSKRRIE